MTRVPTYTATIYLSLEERYNGFRHGVGEIQQECQLWTDSVGACVTITENTFVYKQGYEKGVAIGFINYPRFPKNPPEIKKQALELAKILKKRFKQYRVSIVCSDETIMLGSK